MPQYYAKTVYTDRSDGETTFAIDFTYASQDDVKVDINGAPTTEYTWSDSSTISLNNPTSAGDDIAIYRVTDLSTRAVDFVNAAELTEADLDASAEQVFRAMQEAHDLAADSFTPNPDGSLSMGNRRLQDVTDPANPQDVATKNYVDGLILTNEVYRDEALSAKTAAEAARDAAQLAEGNAASSEANADADAITASNAATSAIAARDTTQSVRDTFVNTEQPNAISALQSQESTSLSNIVSQGNTSVAAVVSQETTSVAAVVQAETDALASIAGATTVIDQATLDTTLLDYYTIVAADAKFANKTDVYTKTEIDSGFIDTTDTAYDSSRLGGLLATNYLQVTGVAADSSKLGGVSASGYLTTSGTAYNSDRLGNVAAANYTRKDSDQYRTVTQGMSMGIHAGYGVSSGSGTNWGADIWSMGVAYDGTAAGVSYNKGSGKYGVSWLRSTNSGANANIGEGFYVFRAGALLGGIGQTGVYSAGEIAAASDRRLKKNFECIDEPLQKCAQLCGYTYDRKDIELRQNGLVAQQVQQVLPNSVTAADDENGTLAVNYNGVVALLVNCVNELTKKVSELEGKHDN